MSEARKPPETLYERLVGLFRAQGVCWMCREKVGTLEKDIHTHYVQGERYEEPCPIPHLATLAVEQAREVFRDVVSKNVQLGDHYASFEAPCPHRDEHLRWLDAALGEVKRGS